MGSRLLAAPVLCGLAILACAPDETPARPRPIHADATAYCQSGTTRSGEQTRQGVVAADPRVLPLRTIIRIDAPDTEHDGVYTVLDTGSAVKGRVVTSICRTVARPASLAGVRSSCTSWSGAPPTGRRRAVEALPVSSAGCGNNREPPLGSGTCALPCVPYDGYARMRSGIRSRTQHPSHKGRR
jgi:hypothetical protein